MNRVWSLLDSDTRLMELSMALIGTAFSISCWFGSWFGGWLESAASLHGYEPAAGLLGLVFNGFHARAAFSNNYKWRQHFALANAFTLAGLAVAILLSHGLTIPGGPVLMVGSMINVWIFLSLHADRVDREQHAHWRD